MYIKKILCILLSAAVFPVLSVPAIASNAGEYGYSCEEAARLMATQPGFSRRTMSCETWYPYEIPLTAQGSYAVPFDDVTVDCVFYNAGKNVVLTVPAFWDGENGWKVRFALTCAGEWEYRTVCSSGGDGGLHNVSGFIDCTPYGGALEIFRRGFVTAESGKRYFTYADGTPFFYLGDTHWGMASEELDSPGDHAGETGAASHFKYIVDRRAAQGFTVYQSEPIGATYNLSDGVTQSDIGGFGYLDRQFDYIAKAGLVHANAEFFYPAEMANDIFRNKAYLEKLCRYWVARYAAYPVLWTLGQETDTDFYGVFDRETNPYLDVCAYITKYDPYNHPLSAHQENAGKTTASSSIFRDIADHDWYAAQWSPSLKSVINFDVPKDYWINGGDKISILYEGRYENLWTKNFGARVQGWAAYLNGMYGYGYGCADIWLYHSTYDTDTTSNDGVDKITPADKAVYWSESVEFETAAQLGIMKEFLTEHEWWTLTPCFDDRTCFSESNVYNFMKWLAAFRFNKFGDYWTQIKNGISFKPFYSVVTDGDGSFIAYFYNKTTFTGRLNGLEKGAAYSFSWLNPRTGDYTDAGDCTVKNGRYKIPDKPDGGDWVFVAEKV